MEAQPQPPLPCSALGSSGALSLPGPPGSRNKTAVPVWGGDQEPQGKQVPCSKLPSPDPTHARRVTRAEPQAGGDTEKTGRSQRGGAGHSACTPALAYPQATFPDPGVCWEPFEEHAVAGAMHTAGCSLGLGRSFPVGLLCRKQLTHTSASPRLKTARLEPSTLQSQAPEPSSEGAPPL